MKLFVDRLKTVIYTLISVAIIGFTFWIWASYENSKVEAQEIETQEIVDTLEEIISVTKPDFERANNQTFIDSVGACVNYIYNTTTDIIPVNFEILLAQAALESGWGNSRFALEGNMCGSLKSYVRIPNKFLPSNANLLLPQPLSKAA